MNIVEIPFIQYELMSIFFSYRIYCHIWGLRQTRVWASSQRTWCHVLEVIASSLGRRQSTYSRFISDLAAMFRLSSGKINYYIICIWSQNRLSNWLIQCLESSKVPICIQCNLPTQNYIEWAWISRSFVHCNVLFVTTLNQYMINYE